ncbi:MAG: response regulator transcription factor [Verrucomicrobia bacterium]|nr:response regulator transcription factor [Verrucomicrobiota bacterium]
MRLLVVEDELKMADYLRRALEGEGHAVEEAHDGDEALARALGEPFDAIVLDLNLPRRDGLDVLRQLRAAGRPTPVLILSARGQVDDRVAGLHLGADDYLPKPFAMAELLARVQALLREAVEERPTQLVHEDLVLDVATRSATRAGVRVDLPMREYGLLELLLRCAGRTLSRAQILEHVWGYHFDPGTNLVDVYIQRLRRKIDDAHPRKLIHTVSGLGYRLGAES